MTLQRDVDLMPTRPGVYLMKDAKGTVLYIGKAKNLRQRVRQYLVPGGDGRVTIPYLMAKVESIETIVVSSEKEALLLENTLIKQHRPRYNALLKDDKTYLALKINDKHPWPKVSLVRYKGIPKDDGRYFGPYTSGEGARKTFDLLNSLFPLRQCSDQELLRRTRPCILYDMKKCVAPCVGKCTKEEYASLVDKTVKFLRGQDSDILKELYREMDAASESLEFEKAGAIYKTICQIEKTIEKQSVDTPHGFDGDVLALFRQGDEVSLSQLNFFSGKLTGSRNYHFSKVVEEDEELFARFILQHYGAVSVLPREILAPILPTGHQALEEVIAEGKRKVAIAAPQRGEKKALVEIARKNAEAAFHQEKDAVALREKMLLEMQETFRLLRYPRRIECIDNSNIAGTLVVSSLVSFLDGTKDTSHYRKYKIKNVTPGDDYGAMRETLERRFRRGKEENDLPDLLVVDGGKGHLNAALKVLEELNIASVDVIGLAKEEGRHDKGISGEQVFLPNVKDPILLKRTSPILFLLQQIRDEAHRTAITYHRKLRSKKQVHSALDDIAGIGPVKRKALLVHFGSVKALLEASEADLQSVKGLSQSNIASILAFIAAKKEGS